MVSVCLPSDALTTPTVLVGFLLPWVWGISSRLLQQSAAAAPYLGAETRVRNAVLGCNLKNDRMTSVHFQGKPFNIMVIEVYALLKKLRLNGSMKTYKTF